MNNANKKFGEQIKRFKGKVIGILLLELMILTIVFTVKASMMIGGEQAAIEKYATISQTYAVANYSDVVEVTEKKPVVIDELTIDYVSGENEADTIEVTDENVGEDDSAATVDEETQTEPETAAVEPTAEPTAEPNNIDWDGLNGVNSDTTGWLKVPGTSIDYPVVVHATDNNFYLHHDFYGKYDESGVPYLDNRNDVNSDYAFVIWGHTLKSGAMFSALKHYLEQPFFNEFTQIEFDKNGSHAKTTWDIFSVGVIDTRESTTAKLLGFGKDRSRFLEMVKKNSTFYRDIDLGDRQVIILATCKGGIGTTNRLLVYAVQHN